MSIDRPMDKQMLVYPCNGTLSCLKNEGNSNTCSTMDEPCGHDPRWDKPVTERQMLYDCTCMRSPELSDTDGRENGGCSGLGETGTGCQRVMGADFHFGEDEKLLEMDVGNGCTCE